MFLLNAFRFGSAAAAAAYFNPSDSATELTLSNLNKTATRSTTNDGSWRSVRGVTSHSSGKWYAECINVANGAGNGNMLFGVGQSTASLSSYPGSGADSWGNQANNTIDRATYHNGTQTNQSSTAAVAAGGYCMVAVDFDAGKLWFGNDGTWHTLGNPGAGTTPTYNITANLALFLMLGESNSPQQCTLRTAAADMAGTIPSGFSAWG